MGTDVELKQEWSTDKAWYKLRDPRPQKVREVDGSRTVQDRWFYGQDDGLELRFESTPERGFAIYYREERVGFSPEISPEPVLGDSIRAAKQLAVEVLKERKRQASSRG